MGKNLRTQQRSASTSTAGICERCGGGFHWRGNGSPRRFCCTACRRAFEARIRRVGLHVLVQAKAGDPAARELVETVTCPRNPGTGRAQ